MEWKQLLSSKRQGEYITRARTTEFSRNEFQRDFDRIVFSTPFRRLQKKTQVHPIPQIDVIHNRLTHSLESASVGRSLGAIVGRRVIDDERQKFGETGSEKITADDFASVVAAACLAHDIGNPPLGHSGERAIADYYKRKLRKPGGFWRRLNPSQQADLKGFQGNAMGFRILTHTAPSQSKLAGGLRLTYATLGAFTKYPTESTPELSGSIKAHEKSFGFFQTEKELFKTIATNLGLKRKRESGYEWHRHPLAFLVEAADDICYRIMDLEDGCRLVLIDFNEAQPILKDIAQVSKREIDKIRDRDERWVYLRGKAINRLIEQVAECFLERKREIMAGSFDCALISCVPSSPCLEKIRIISEERIYNDPRVIEMEAAGFEVLPNLLDTFSKAVMLNSDKDRKIRQLIPEQYLDNERQPFEDKYETLVSVAQFVSSMTDTHAIDTYRIIKGISMPNY